MNINALNQINATVNSVNNNNKVSGGSNVFKNMIDSHLNKIRNLEDNANEKIEQYVTGEIDNVHDVMLAIEDMQLTLETTIEVRNKLIEAYQEMNKMQL